MPLDREDPFEGEKRGVEDDDGTGNVPARAILTYISCASLSRSMRENAALDMGSAGLVLLRVNVFQ